MLPLEPPKEVTYGSGQHGVLPSGCLIMERWGGRLLVEMGIKLGRGKTDGHAS